jgi:hypothetical protein
VHSQQRFFAMAHGGEVTVDQAHRGYSCATDAGGFASVNPLFMKYAPSSGAFAGQLGYGYRSIEAFVRAVADLRDGKVTLDDLNRSDLASIQTTAMNTAILEAGRRSLDNRPRLDKLPRPSHNCSSRRRHLRKHEALPLVVDAHAVAVADLAREDLASEAVLDALLDDALQGSRAELRVVAFARERDGCRRRDTERDAARREALAQVAELDLDDAAELLARQRVEDHGLVDAVQELRPQVLLQDAAHMRFDHRIVLVALGHLEDGV